MADDKKTCFIIMPITTPKLMLEVYRDGADHFSHVLEHLFMPSVNKAGYAPVCPTMKGADIIHGKIVTNPETADLVLCDMSCLNANVFFELGIRTSLDKPVCLVKDDQTKNVPFDTGIINFHEYKSGLEHWDMNGQINNLAEHLKASAEGSEGGNTLWRVFAMQAKSKPYEGKGDMETKVDYLALQIESLRQKIDQSQGTSSASGRLTVARNMPACAGELQNYVAETLYDTGLQRFEMAWAAPHMLMVSAKAPISIPTRKRIVREGLDRYNVHVLFNILESEPSPSPEPSPE